MPLFSYNVLNPFLLANSVVRSVTIRVPASHWPFSRFDLHNMDKPEPGTSTHRFALHPGRQGYIAETLKCCKTLLRRPSLETVLAHPFMYYRQFLLLSFVLLTKNAKSLDSLPNNGFLNATNILSTLSGLIMTIKLLDAQFWATACREISWSSLKGVSAFLSRIAHWYLILCYALSYNSTFLRWKKLGNSSTTSPRRGGSSVSSGYWPSCYQLVCLRCG